MIRAKVGRTSGILNPSAIAAKFQLSRHVPAQDLSYFVQHFWVVRWDLCNQAPYQQETLPYPVVHLVIEHDKSRIVGVIKGKFSTLLHDRGWVFGVKAYTDIRCHWQTLKGKPYILHEATRQFTASYEELEPMPEVEKPAGEL